MLLFFVLFVFFHTPAMISDMPTHKMCQYCIISRLVWLRSCLVFSIKLFWLLSSVLQVVNRKNQGYGLPADIWSLGCTVLEMLTRQIPYSHLECVSIMFLHFLFVLDLYMLMAR